MNKNLLNLILISLVSIMSVLIVYQANTNRTSENIQTLNMNPDDLVAADLNLSFDNGAHQNDKSYHLLRASIENLIGIQNNQSQLLQQQNVTINRLLERIEHIEETQFSNTLTLQETADANSLNSEKLNERFSNEIIDEQWALDSMQELSNLIEANSADGTIELLSVDCASTLCKLEILGHTPDSALQAVQNSAVSIGWNDTVFTEFEQQDDKTRVTSYFFRKQG